MASIEFITKRIECKQKEISKLEKKLARIIKAQESNWENNPYYYTESDLKWAKKEEVNGSRAGAAKPRQKEEGTMKEYRVRCERVEISNDGKETRRMTNPVNKSGESIIKIFEFYEDAHNACEKYRAFSAEYEKHCATMRKRYPDLYSKEIRFDHFRIETREVTEWTF